MELSNLQAFIAVAGTGSFSAAGDQLHLTQPAISKRIATLETELNTKLFDRIGRHPHLTEAGQVLLPKTLALLDDVTDIRRTLSNLGGQVAGTLTIGTSHHIGLHRLPSVLKSYTSKYPDVKLDLRFMDSERACHAVEQGELELAIVTLPNETSPKLNLQKVWHDPLRFVVNTQHPLAKQKKLSLQQLLEYTAVLPGRGTYTWEILERCIKSMGLEIKTDLSTNYLETLKMLTTVGLGWSLLPETLIDKELIALNISSPKLHRYLGIVTHRERTPSNAGQMMIAACTDESQLN